MRELSLFSGAGGGLLASKHLLGWGTVGYVEWDGYCQRVIAQRIKDGFLDEAPIFGDIRTFIGDGYAESYQGLVDVITAGFPCQPWSTAARGRTISAKDLWPETMSCISIVQPTKVLLENVSKKAIARARIDLEGSGYACRCATVSAASVGAPIERKRYWLFAESNDEVEPSVSVDDEVEMFAKAKRVDWWNEDIAGTLGIFDGVAHRVERNRVIGQGQVPWVAAEAWRLLNGKKE